MMWFNGTLCVLKLYHNKSVTVMLRQYLCYGNLTLSQNKSCFLYACGTSLLKTLWEQKKLFVMSYFSFSPQWFFFLLPVWRTFCHVHQVQNCCLQILSVWRSLKFVVWVRVTMRWPGKCLH